VAKCKTIEYTYQEPLMQYGSQIIKVVYELNKNDDPDRVLVEAEKVVAKQFQTPEAREMFKHYGAKRLVEKIKEERRIEEEKKKEAESIKGSKPKGDK